ncbi:hypothetical protein DL96DRAFT_1645284, partial [Flagelloscypha sp. PMI_526]
PFSRLRLWLGANLPQVAGYLIAFFRSIAPAQDCFVYHLACFPRPPSQTSSSSTYSNTLTLMKLLILTLLDICP